MCDIGISCNASVKKEITYRKFNDIPVDQFKSDLMKSILVCQPSQDLTCIVQQYHTCLTELIDKYAPLTTKVIKIRKTEPWYDSSISEKKQKCRKAERKWRKSKLILDQQEFKKCRNELHKVINSLKTKYYTNLIESHKDNSNLFSVLNKINAKCKETPLPPDIPRSNLPNIFAKYFKDKIDNIRNEFEPNENYMEYDTESPSQFTSFKLVTIPDVIKLIKESQNKQCALDPIPTSLLKKCSNELAPVICNIINSSLESATVPSEFKCALVTPLIKKPDAKYELKNYRPVSNLPYVSKLVEKVVSVQLKSYKEDNGLNEELQSAYKNIIALRQRY